MAPFTGDGVGAGQHLLVDDDAATHTGAENDPENDFGTTATAIDRFGERKTVGIVGQPDLPLEQGLQVAAQRLADQAG